MKIGTITRKPRAPSLSPSDGEKGAESRVRDSHNPLPFPGGQGVGETVR